MGTRASKRLPRLAVGWHPAIGTMLILSLVCHRSAEVSYPPGELG
jgi:hypothetical protein